jgi:hypothetical protein
MARAPCPPNGLDRMDPEDAEPLQIHRPCSSSLHPEERPALERIREVAQPIHQQCDICCYMKINLSMSVAGPGAGPEGDYRHLQI